MSNTYTHHELAATFQKVRNNADGSYNVKCPLHDGESDYSMTISQGRKNVVVHCHATCDQKDLIRACNKRMQGRAPGATPVTEKRESERIHVLPAPAPCPDDHTHPKFGEPTHRYEYASPKGMLWFYNCRFELADGTKEMRPLTYTTKPDGSEGRWQFTAPDAGQRYPYRIEKLSPEGDVLISEGEKAADRAAELAPELSHVAWWGGANAWHYTDWSALAGRVVWLLPDADKPTEKLPHGASVAAMEKLGAHLSTLGCTVHFCGGVHKALETMGVDWKQYKGFDAADGFDIKWTHATLVQYMELAREFATDTPATAPVTADDIVTGLDALLSADGAAPAPTTPTPFIALGYNRDSYYYLSKESKQIHTLTPGNHKDLCLLSLCSNESWWTVYSDGDNRPNWKRAAARMMHDCKRAGLYTPDLTRGRGAWFDNGKVVLHLGNRLIVDGVETDILSRPGRYVYELSKAMRGPGDETMSDEEGALLFEICQSFSWEKPIFAKYLAGWVVLAPICGALEWRPHAWITGGAGTGKSTIGDHFVRPLLGNMVLVAQGSSTEAGIRQSLGCDAIPVLFDESESEDERGRQRMNTMLQLVRHSSSETTAQTIKGGSGGKAQSFHIRSMFLLSSIGVSLTAQADKTRVTVLSLRPSTNEWLPLKAKLNTITDTTSRRLMARTVSLIPTIRHNARLIASKIAKTPGASQRLGDQYGTLLAGYVALQSRLELTDEAATDLVNRHVSDFSDAVEGVERDEDQCLQTLLQAIIMVDTVSPARRMTVGELVSIAAMKGHTEGVTPDQAEAILRRYGMGVRNGSFCVARTHSRLADLLRGTPWANDWCRFLLRVAGAVSGAQKMRFAGSKPGRVVEIPIKHIEEGQDQPDDDIGF